jgi:adenylylsulfate kinase
MNHLFSTENQLISREEKEKLLSQNGICIWVTGLSGSGKTTIAKYISKELHNKGVITKVLDGDNIRLGINKNLTFSVEDREENIRRTAEISKLFVDCGIVTICCLVTPTEKIRNIARGIIGEKDFCEVYIATSIEECERRDTKGLYKKARKGEIKNFTGISSPFEAPKNPDLIINTENKSIKESGDLLLKNIINKIKL